MNRGIRQNDFSGRLTRVFLPLAGLSLAGLPLLGMLGACGGSTEEMQSLLPKPSAKTNPFAPVPECKGPAVSFAKGESAMVIAKLELAAANQGFDLDGDGKKDNKLGALASLANTELDATFTERHDVVIPIEFFGLTAGDSDCTKFAFYLGQWNQNRDKDKADTNWASDENGALGDCNDQDKSVFPGHAEVLGNRMDDDCDGFADNMTRKKPPADNSDLDGDGYTPAQGDCDDRAGGPADVAMLAFRRHPGAPELCDGIDYNCDGIPDNGPDCDPFGSANAKIPIQSVSIDPMTQKPQLVFGNGQVKGGKLSAGPSLFRIDVPIVRDTTLALELSGTHIEGTFGTDAQNGLPKLDDAMLGGVLEAVSLARLDMLKAKGFLTPPQSLFDAVWASNTLATVLVLKRDADDHVLPDMDVDGDGLETFWASDPDMSPPLVDTCRDGDGTIIKNGDTQYPNDDPMKRCVFAKDAQGNYRFVDGISAALKFKAVPARIGEVLASTVDPTAVY